MRTFDNKLLCRFFRRQWSAAALLTAACLQPDAASAQSAGVSTWWQQAKDKLVTIYRRGDLEGYLAGYSYHGRHTYSERQLDELNENTWGAGIGTSIRNENGNLETIFFLGIEDSRYQPQLMAGYAYQWIWPVVQSGGEIGVGISPMLVSRPDYFGGFPFPVILPIASVGSKTTKLFFSYVPRLSKNKGNGDVLFTFIGLQFP